MKKNFIFVLIVALLLAASAFYFKKYQDVQKLLKNPQEASKTEVQDLTGKVGRLMVLPKDEQPTIATVQDKSKLKDQPFFAKSENGDKALLYIKAKRAILYRPSTNKIIDVAPINIQQTEQKGAKAEPTKNPSKESKVTPSPTKAQ